jgi:hypothetical protein
VKIMFFLLELIDVYLWTGVIFRKCFKIIEGICHMSQNGEDYITHRKNWDKSVCTQ